MSEARNERKELNSTDLLAKLSEGWTLELRGNGWHLYEPRKAYTRTAVVPIDSALVEREIKSGRLETKEGMWHVEAFLSANTEV